MARQGEESDNFHAFIAQLKQGDELAWVKTWQLILGCARAFQSSVLLDHSDPLASVSSTSVHLSH
jgi:hypothetical protein